jgi:hypothetical protein
MEQNTRFFNLQNNHHIYVDLQPILNLYIMKFYFIFAQISIVFCFYEWVISEEEPLPKERNKFLV